MCPQDPKRRFPKLSFPRPVDFIAVKFSKLADFVVVHRLRLISGRVVSTLLLHIPSIIHSYRRLSKSSASSIVYYPNFLCL